MFKVSKGFQGAGWAQAGGAMLRSLGSALVAYVFTGPATLGTWRIRIGARVTVLERKAHGTPTGRCSRGHWERMADAPTPQRAAEWSELGKFWAFVAGEHGTTPGPWQRHHSGDVNRCITRAASLGDEASEAGARGKVGKHHPSRREAFGWAPAAGRNVGSHSDAAIKAMRRARRRGRANERYAAMREAGKVRTYHRSECSGHGPCRPGLRCWRHEGEAN